MKTLSIPVKITISCDDADVQPGITDVGDPTTTPHKSNRILTNVPLDLQQNRHSIRLRGRPQLIRRITSVFKSAPLPTRTPAPSPHSAAPSTPKKPANTPRVLTPRTKSLLLTPKTKKAFGESIQRHHIIPRSLWGRGLISKELQLHVDGEYNLVSLPTGLPVPQKLSNFSTPSKSDMSFQQRQETSSPHWGSHSKQYFALIKTKLLEIQQKFNERPNLTKEAYAFSIALAREEILNFLKDIKIKLLYGEILLNSSRRQLKTH